MNSVTNNGESGLKRGRIRVHIVGGGCAGIAAAWALAKQPGFEIVVYEQRPYLGGKGASTRDEHGRVLEHGLHVWLGFYENAFAMMRECYRIVEQNGWGPDAEDPAKRLPHGSFEDAFFPEPHIGVAGLDSKGQWAVWSGQLPPSHGEPGTPLDSGSNPFSLQSYLLHALNLLRALVLSTVGSAKAGAERGSDPDTRSATDEAQDLDFESEGGAVPKALIETLTLRLRGGVLVSASLLLQATAILEDALRSWNFAPEIADSVLSLAEALSTQIRRQLSFIVSLDPAVRWKTTVTDLVMTIIVGLYRDRVFWSERGLDSLNGIDYRTWLRKHGASPESLESPFLRGIYDLVFAYRDGDVERPALAAGVALRGALRMFLGYRGAMFWRMRSGMGDTVFAPLYKVLKDAPRGDKQCLKSTVRFEFNADLTSVKLEPDGERDVRIESLTFKRGPRDPSLDHLGSWLGFVSGGESQNSSAEDIPTKDDAVIFACGPNALWNALEQSGEEMLAELSELKRAVDDAPGVATKSAQIWCNRALEDLGWLRGSVVVSGLGAPWGTWADMSHVLASESAWRLACSENLESPESPFDNARSLSYLCSVAGADENIESVRSELEHVLGGEARGSGPWTWMRSFWPAALSGKTGIRVEDSGLSLSSDEPTAGLHVRLNEMGSDRYAQSLPGKIDHRISPLHMTFSNATVAGDWTACGLDVGCVEAAVMSGLLAAHAITGGTPSLDSITGFHHP